MEFIPTFLLVILGIVVFVIVYIVLSEITEVHFANGQNATPPKPTTSVPNITPTSPNPNLQYLPQKAYVIPFAPENGIPNTPPMLSSLPAGAAPIVTQPVVQAAPIQNSSIMDGLDIAAILALVGTGVTYVKSHLVGKKTNDNEGLVKETMAAEVKSKDQIGELARLLFEWNEQKSNVLNGTAPAVKLETLKDDKEDFAEKTAKA